VSVSEPPHGLTRTVVRGAGVAGVGFALTQALSLGFALVLARVAAPRDFGEFAAGSILVVVGAIFTESGMLAALIQRRDRIEEAANTALVSTILSGIGLGLLALGLAPVVGLVFGSRDIGLVAAAMSGSLVLTSLQIVPNALMQRRFSFVRRVVTDPLGAIAFGVTATVACASGLGVWGLVLGAYTGVLIHACLSWILARWRPRPRLASVAMWRELIAFARHVLASEIVIRVHTTIETVLVGRFVSTPALGQYQYAQRIARQPLTAQVNIAAYVLLPAFAHIAADESRLRTAFVRSLRWTAIVSLPLSLVLLPLGEPLAVLLLGETWRPAGRAVAGLCLYGAGQAFGSIASEVFKASGRPELLPRMHLVSLVLSVGLMLAFLPFGLVGIAAAVSVSSMGMAAYALYAASDVLRMPVRLLLAHIWPPAVAALAMVAATLPLEQLVVDAEGREGLLGPALLAAEAILAAGVFLGVLRIVAPPFAHDIARAFVGGGRGLIRVVSRSRGPGAARAEPHSR
jgi:O-antigen/teichoic acid export membrane protein